MILSQIFNPKSINIDLKSDERDEVFEELIEELVAVNPGLDRAAVLCCVQEREAKMSTGIKHGIAVPHGKCAAVKGVMGAVGISRKGIDYESLDKAPVHLIFLIVFSPDSCEDHLNALKKLALVLEDPTFVDSLMEKTTPQAVYDTICRYEDNL